MSTIRYRAYLKDKSEIGRLSGDTYSIVENEFVKLNNLYNQDIEVQKIAAVDVLTNGLSVHELSVNKKEIRVYYNNSEFSSFSDGQKEKYWEIFNLNDYQNPTGGQGYCLMSLKNYNFYKVVSKYRDIKTYVKEPYSLVFGLETPISDGDDGDKYIIVRIAGIDSFTHNFYKNFEEEEYNNNINYQSLIPNFNIIINDDDFDQVEYSYNNIIDAETSSGEQQTIISLLNNEEIEVDYTDKSNFVHFGLAESLLNNFVTKIFSGDKYSYLTGYEKYLFNNWKKDGSDNFKLIPIADLGNNSFYYQELERCKDFDNNNINKLINTFIPEYLLTYDNSDFIYFVNFIGNIYDVFRLKSKALREKYKVFDFKKDIRMIKMLLTESDMFLDTNFDKVSVKDYKMLENKERLDYNILLRLLESLPFIRKTKGTTNSIKSINNIYGSYFVVSESGGSFVVNRFDDGQNGGNYDNPEIDGGEVVNGEVDIRGNSKYGYLYEDAESQENNGDEFSNNENYININIVINPAGSTINTYIDSIDSKSEGGGINFIQPIISEQVKNIVPFKANLHYSKVLNQEGVSSSFKPGSFKSSNNTRVGSKRIDLIKSKKDILSIGNNFAGNVITGRTVNNNIVNLNNEITKQSTKSFITKTTTVVNIEQNVIEKFGKEDVKIDVIKATNTRITSSEE